MTVWVQYNPCVFCTSLCKVWAGEGDTVADPQYLDQTTANVRGTISADTIQLISQLDGNLEYYSPAFAFVHHFIVITIT